MKTVKWVIVSMAGLLLVLVAVGYWLPARTQIERATYIDSTPEVVYGLMADLSQFQHWTPWQGPDGNIRYRAGEPARGLGATLSWQSEEPAIGAGRLTVIDARPHNKLRLLLDFEDGGQAVLGYRLEPLEGGTHIDWILDIEHGEDPLSRYRGLLVERRLSAAFEPGLDRLRRLTERQPALPEAGIVTEEVAYEVDGGSFTGYLAYDRNRPPAPGVLVVHEWWGHDEYVRGRAEQLAELGYTAFALDMYGDGKQAGHPDQAMEFSGEVRENFETAKQRFTAALDILKNHSATDPRHLAAIGYCFGGGLVLDMARAGVKLDGAVSFHGSLAPARDRARQGEVEASVLVLNGADDPLVPEEQRRAFREEMDAAGVDYEFINYPGATHAFTNPAADDYAEKFDLPVAYNKAADEQSWQKMRDFFARVFR